MKYDWLNNDELLLRTAEARRAAHDAPKRIQTAANGDVSITGSKAYADRAHDWSELASEVDRRGLKQPALDHGVTNGQ